jgi:S1-C subfamily serine protease
MNSLKQIMQYGEVRHIWLGFTLSQHYGESTTTLQKSELIVTGIENGSPVFIAGLQKDDVITHINGTEVSDIPTAKKIIANIEVGTEIKFRIIRGDKTMELNFKAQLPPNSHTKT